MKRPKVRSDMISRLADIIKGKRAGVFIDAANLYYAGTNAGIKISFDAVSEWFTLHTKQVFLRFYTAFDPEDSKQGEFLQYLSTIGYEVVKKPIKIQSNITKGNMDIELALDAAFLASTYDICILMSGDGDFSYLLEKLHLIKKETIVIGVGGFTSFELHKSAQQYFFLDRLGKLWQNKLKFNVQDYKIFIDEVQENDYTIQVDEKLPVGSQDFTAPKKAVSKKTHKLPAITRLTKLKKQVVQKPRKQI